MQTDNDNYGLHSQFTDKKMIFYCIMFLSVIQEQAQEYDNHTNHFSA